MYLHRGCDDVRVEQAMLIHGLISCAFSWIIPELPSTIKICDGRIFATVVVFQVVERDSVEKEESHFNTLTVFQLKYC